VIFADPIGHILRGISFDSSSHGAEAFYVHTFFQPLCVPAEHMHWTLGFRLTDMDGYDGWNSNRSDLLIALRDAVMAKALPFLASVETLEGAARTAEAISSSSPVQENAAFCWLLAGDVKRAASLLENSCNWLSRNVDNDIAWQLELLRRIEHVRDLLQNDPDAAVKQLLVWEAETVERIGFTSEWSSAQT
jgi:hypothetical protein